MKINNKNFREIYNTHFEPVCRFLNYYTRNEKVIEAVVQDVFVKLWEEREVHDIQVVKTYLYNAARNKILAELRDPKNRNVLLEHWAKREIENQQTEDSVDTYEFVLFLQATVDALPSSSNEFLKISRVKSINYKEIVAEINISLPENKNENVWRNGKLISPLNRI